MTTVFAIAFVMGFGGVANATRYSYESYDDIVDKLQRRNDGSLIRSPEPRRLFDGQIHGGIGMSQTFFQTASSDGDENGMGHSGLFLSLGTEIFNPSWSIEGSYQNFGRSEGALTAFDLTEFSAKIFRSSQLSYRWFLRFGAGLSLRLLQVSDRVLNRQTNYTTPNIAFTVGADTFLNDSLSLGADLNYKNAISQEAVDYRSIDLSIRLNVHF